MEILEAFCVELARVVDIYDAQEEFFALPANQRKRFTFRCSDDACRAINNPLVSGVNYDKLAEDSEKYRQPHFRAPKGHIHIGTCFWVQGTQGQHSDDTEGEADGKSRIERAKATNVIDAFNPGEMDPQLTSPGPAGSLNSPSRGDINSSGNGDGTTRTHEGFTRTSRLERFIDCWAQLEPEERCRHQVAIEGRILSYRQAVLGIKWINPEENGTRIVCGGARLNLWPEDAPKRLYVNFMDDCERFPEHNGSRTLTIDFPLSRIRSYRGGALMLHRIERALTPGHYARVYCWGHITPRDHKPGYKLEIASLNNLVLKVIAMKSGN